MFELVHELSNDLRLGKFVNFNKIPETLAFDCEILAGHPKGKL